MRRLVIVQETGMQLGSPGWPETHIQEFVPWDDVEFGKKCVNKLNEKTDLPYYLMWCEVKCEHPKIETKGAKP